MTNLIDRYYVDMLNKNDKLLIQVDLQMRNIMVEAVGDTYIFLNFDQAVEIRDFLTEFLNGDLDG